MPIYTSERDVALDLVAALEMYEGLMGSDETSIEAVEPAERERVIITLDNGDKYELTVREVRA